MNSTQREQFIELTAISNTEIDKKAADRTYPGTLAYERALAVTETTNEIAMLTNMILTPVTSSKKHNKLIKKAVTEQIDSCKLLLDQLENNHLPLSIFDAGIKEADDKTSALVHKLILSVR